MAKRAPSHIGSWLSVRFRALFPNWAAAMFLGVPMARRLRFDPAADKLRSGPRGLIAPSAFLTGQDRSAKPKRRMRNVDAHIPADLFLKRTITAPPGARGKIRTLAELDLRQGTPFKPDEVHFQLDRPDHSGDKIQVVQWVAKRDDIAQWRAGLAVQGLRLRKIFVADSGLSEPIADLTSEFARGARRLRFLNALLVLVSVGACTFALLYPAWVALHQTARLGQSLTDLRAEAVSLRAEVEAMRAQEVERAAFLDLLLHRPLLVETLRELTVALPDDVWIATVDFRPERVIVTGETSGSAAETVLSLSKRRQFADPRISGPVARTASNAERFEVTLGLGLGG